MKKTDAIHFPTLRQHATSPSKFLKIKLVVVALKLPPIWDNNPASRQMSEQNRKKFWEFMKVIKWVKTNFARYFIHQTNSTCLNSHGIKWFCDWLRYVRYMDNQSWHINCGTPCIRCQEGQIMIWWCLGAAMRFWVWPGYFCTSNLLYVHAA